MPLKIRKEEKKGGMGGKAALLVGGAGLLLFILGVKRSYRLADGREVEQPGLRRHDDTDHPAEDGRDA